MKRRQRLLMIGAVVAVAAGAGQLMQGGGASTSRVVERTAAATPLPQPVVAQSASLAPAGTLPTSADPAAPASTVAAATEPAAIKDMAVTEPVANDLAAKDLTAKEPAAEDLAAKDAAAADGTTKESAVRQAAVTETAAPGLPAAPALRLGALSAPAFGTPDAVEPAVPALAAPLAPDAAPDAEDLAAAPEAASDGALPKSCTADIALIARPGAMLDIGLLAPCRIGERAVIRHGGLAVTALTSAAGTLTASIPALTSPAAVTILFADGSTASGTTGVPDLADFDRFAVQWMDADAFQLHAYAGQAVFGDPGHVSAAAPGAVSPEGGFLSLIGSAATDRSLLAEVYTFPAGSVAAGGGVRLDLEAAVTEATCGREILGETIELAAGLVTIRDLSISMPACDAVGEFVVLHDPVSPVPQVASN